MAEIICWGCFNDIELCVCPERETWEEQRAMPEQMARFRIKLQQLSHERAFKRDAIALSTEGGDE